MVKKTEQEIKAELSQFTGTEGYHYNALFGNKFVYTDGIKRLIELCECYWLLTDIFSYRRLEDFQLWTLKVEDSKAILTMKEDSDLPNIVTKKYSFTDFPLDEIGLYAQYDGERVVLMLKSEY